MPAPALPSAFALLRSAGVGGLWISSLLLAVNTVPARSGEAVGVNLSADEDFGARSAALATRFAGFAADPGAVANAPASLGDLHDLAFSFSHVERFGEANYDNLAFVLPFHSRATFGLGFSRYGVDGIECYTADLRRSCRDAGGLVSASDSVFSVADYTLVAAFARRFGAFDLGGNLHLLYRRLDQEGYGARGDLAAHYTFADFLRISGLLKGALPSSSRWESDYFEYEKPEFFAGLGLRLPSDYFYGVFHFTLETPGLLHDGAKSSARLEGARFKDEPLKVLARSKVGAEYAFDLGLSLRAGIEELAADFSPSFGIGYRYKGRVGIDYAFSPHPELLSTHRIALHLSPVWPRFDGRGFRPGHPPAQPGSRSSRPSRDAAPEPAELREEAPEEGVQEEEIREGEEEVPPAIHEKALPSPASEKTSLPAGASRPAPPADASPSRPPAATVPRAVAPALPAPPAETEVLEEAEP